MIRYNPNHQAPTVLGAVPDADLPKALAHARRQLAKHKAKRPSHEDIPALTRWALEKDLLAMNVEVLERQDRARWREVPTPGQRQEGRHE